MNHLDIRHLILFDEKYYDYIWTTINQLMIDYNIYKLLRDNSIYSLSFKNYYVLFCNDLKMEYLKLTDNDFSFNNVSYMVFKKIHIAIFKVCYNEINYIILMPKENNKNTKETFLYLIESFKESIQISNLNNIMIELTEQISTLKNKIIKLCHSHKATDDILI